MPKPTTWLPTLRHRLRRDDGAGFVEYAGLLIIIAGIFVLIDQLGLGGLISGAIGDAVDRVVGG
ncbi:MULTISPECIES: hypothetical protein [Streptomyces]|uniref:Flp family type IVb pilin n=1 Tax=Streptomyces evansiae TaxID=3075535 RepID=A0ABD5ED64_9ACTN|nr:MULTISPECIES: hypothetical protein [unclassified Streptomyces]ASY33011.1 hypothetical protein CAC01_10165 [Streptomyces sp. CLI2509]MDT0419324.1 hypothetical protein [Streptomyces sp. DSM 41982]MDT0424758.1 hypothetical protein [Streptomyces sp. DSM 41859]MYX22231.1 hypothetical protein [Streptomyces sp. SID8380]SCE16989.1 hypothetical protein GA0115246_111853 [Streptomyces sp. SolWspMP-sol7th]